MAEDILNQKKTLRQEALRHRVMMDPRAENPEEVGALFFETLKPQIDQIVALYWPIDKEFDPYAIMEQLQHNGNLCALPVVVKGSRVLKFAVWKEGDPLEEGAYKIPQPVVNEATHWVGPDIVLVPFLAFDRQGYRLGYGGGYYDATLQALRKERDILAVGVGYACQACLFKLPVEEHDEKLDWVITPQGAHYFE